MIRATHVKFSIILPWVLSLSISQTGGGLGDENVRSFGQESGPVGMDDIVLLEAQRTVHIFQLYLDRVKDTLIALPSNK